MYAVCGGTYVPADETQIVDVSLAAGPLHPLEEEIVLLNEDIDLLAAELQAANGALAAATGQVSAKSGSEEALKAEVAKLKLEATPPADRVGRERIGQAGGSGRQGGHAQDHVLEGDGEEAEAEVTQRRHGHRQDRGRRGGDDSVQGGQQGAQEADR